VKFACVLSALACFHSSYAEARKTVQVNESFNGGKVDLKVGEALAVALSENASTGFRWIARAESAHKVAKVLREGESAPDSGGDSPGNPGIRRFQFEAVEPGTVELELEYRRPWETGKPPARTFQLRVRVQSAL
jgi:inhibitor of cysteine peptidase